MLGPGGVESEGCGPRGRAPQPPRDSRDGPGWRSPAVSARTWREARLPWGANDGGRSPARPPVTLLSSWPGRLGGPRSLRLPGALGPGAERCRSLWGARGAASRPWSCLHATFRRPGPRGKRPRRLCPPGSGLAPTAAPTPESPGGRAGLGEGGSAFSGSAPPASLRFHHVRSAVASGQGQGCVRPQN